MAKYALIRAGEIVGYRDLENPEEVAHKVDKRGDGGPFVRPVIDAGKPEINPLIETLEISHKLNPDTVEIVYTVTPRSLSEVKAELIRRVDRDAERERMRHITPGNGQALEYLYVAAEARAFLIDPNGDFPLLQASVDAGEVDSLGEAASTVLGKSAEWLRIGAEIRRRRLCAKRGISDANDVKSAYVAYAS